MAPALSKYRALGIAGGSATCLYVAWLLLRRRRPDLNLSSRKRKNHLNEEVKYFISERKEFKVKAHVDREFLRQICQLLHVMIPGWRSPEAGFLFLVALSLVARSICDLWMINHGTKIESAIVSMNKQLFKKLLLRFIMATPFISALNNVLKFSIGELKLRLRTNMTLRLYEEYLKNFTYYRMSNLDDRIANADQLLTTDVDKFCESVADLYCNTAKPILDIGIYVYKLSSTLGGQTPGIMFIYLLGAGVMLTYLRRPTGRLTATEQKLEGEFRHINARIINHSEEIAFYNGNRREKMTLLSSYAKLLAHLRKHLHFKVTMGVIDNLVAKYLASVVGFLAVSVPFLAANHSVLGGSAPGFSDRSRLYYTYGRMMVKLAEAIGRLVMAGRDLNRLAGFTCRVTQLRKVLQDLHAGKYSRTMVEGSAVITGATVNKVINGNTLSVGAGKLIFQNNVIKFDQVPLVTPNGDLLVDSLTFEIKSGMNVLVCGPNGSGKSSLFRVLGELWPLFGGVVTKPPRGCLFYIPQRPYMTLGCLRDQLTYPHTGSEAQRRGTPDSKLLEFLSLVQLDYLLEREGGLDAIADWLDVLSGGEKQRIAMARLFYHKPQFAILDECTSAVSVDVEGSLYRYCRNVGITLLTVSHRKSLWQHHEFVLHLDGRGSYSFKPIAEAAEFGS